jgi:hypothetical protein
MSPRWRTDAGPHSARVIPIALLLLAGTAGVLWLRCGPHRDFPEHALRAAADRGLLLAGGTHDRGWFSSSMLGVKGSLRRAPGIRVEIGALHFQHWPFVAPRVTVREARAHLWGEPVPLLAAITEAMPAKLDDLVVTRLDIDYQHRVLGVVRFEGVTLSSSGSALRLHAEQARIGGFAWSDVRLAITARKDSFVIGWGGEVDAARLQLSCFPSAGGSSRWLLNLLHQPARPLLGRLGWDLGEALAGASLAGGISLDVPDDSAAPPQGRVHLVLDGWPLGAPAAARAVLGSTVSLLSNLVPAVDGAGWQLPRVEITMPVFSLVGKGHVQLGRQPSLAIEAEGERSCRELRALLPPSTVREQVEGFLAARSVPSRKSQGVPPPPARLELRVSAGAGAGYQQKWNFRPGCGLPAWVEGDSDFVSGP